MAEHKIRTTIRPDEEITVDDAEYTDLTRQGLVAGVVRESSEAQKPAQALKREARHEPAGKDNR